MAYPKKEDLEFIEEALLANGNTTVKTFEDSYVFMRYLKDENNTVPDLIVIDFNIANIDGFKLVSFTTRSNRHAGIPTVSLTNLISQNEENRLTHAGVKKIFLKPATLEGYKQLSKKLFLLIYRVDKEN